jgi:3-hydroxyacyl-[acyl-carrier-protein] dehydratase
VGSALTCAEVLALIPQAPPFRFVDELLELGEHAARGRYRFRPDEYFYRGHFPGNPVTPGVVLLETMAQVGVVAHGIYLYALTHEPAEIARTLIVFADAEVSFLLPVRPGDEVTVRSEKIFFRRKQLRSRVELLLADGAVAAAATISGIGVEKP